MATEKQIDEVFARTDTLLSAGDFAACDEYLDSILHSDDVELLVAALSATWAAWDKLVYRDALIGRGFDRKVAQTLYYSVSFPFFGQPRSVTPP